MEILKPQDQYKELCNDHRFFGDLRFKQLTVWSVVMGILVNAGVSHPYYKDALPFLRISLSAAALTAIFWILEVRSTLKGVIALKKIRQLEEENPRDEMLGKAHWTLVNQTNAMVLVYGTSYLFCWYVMWTHRLDMSCIWRSIVYFALGVWVFLFMFTLREYLPLWEKACKEWKW